MRFSHVSASVKTSVSFSLTSQPIRLSTYFMTLIPSLTFTDYEWFPWSICNGCGMPAGNAYPSGHLVLFPILGLANAPIVETKLLELAMVLLDFSPRIPLGTFSILLCIATKHMCFTGVFASVKTAFAFFSVLHYNASVSHGCLHRLRRFLRFPWYGVTMHPFHTRVCIG